MRNGMNRMTGGGEDDFKTFKDFGNFEPPVMTASGFDMMRKLGDRWCHCLIKHVCMCKIKAHACLTFFFIVVSIFVKIRIP